MFHWLHSRPLFTKSHKHSSNIVQTKNMKDCARFSSFDIKSKKENFGSVGFGLDFQAWRPWNNPITIAHRQVGLHNSPKLAIPFFCQTEHIGAMQATNEVLFLKFFL